MFERDVDLMSPRRARGPGLGAVVALLVLCATAAAAPAQEHAAHGEGGTVPLYDDLGDHGRAITTDSDEAQAYFDQGLRLQYAFNHAEAIRAYQEALRHDPGCAMCWWGIALASGPNINAPMDELAGRRAYGAIGEARELSAGASTVERAVIQALAERYAPDPAAPRPPLDSAYARAMQAVSETHPADPDVLTLYAASLMNLSPWNYWEGDYGARRPRPGTETIVATLERAVELDPENPGACHYYIHAVEAAHPEKAEPCADRLATLMPGAGHIVHMPGHIYIRVGRYADAVRANEHAVHADEAYISDQRPGGLYPSAYYPHNYHFMSFAATMAGMSERAIEAARTVAPKVPPELAAEVYWIQGIVVYPHLTLVTFGRWDEVLEEPMPPAELRNATALAHYARGTAQAALGRMDAAREELAAIEALIGGAATPDPLDPEVVPFIAREALAGEVALRSGDAEGAVDRFEAAAALEDGMIYEEPPVWYYPLRHSLGRALLEAGRPAEAERRYREDLLRFPENGWSLFGLAESLAAQGNEEEAAAARTRFREAWAEADVELRASRF